MMPSVTRRPLKILIVSNPDPAQVLSLQSQFRRVPGPVWCDLSLVRTSLEDAFLEYLYSNVGLVQDLSVGEGRAGRVFLFLHQDHQQKKL